MPKTLRDMIKSISPVKSAISKGRIALLPHPTGKLHRPFSEPVILAGMMSSANGIGQSARYLLEALKRARIQVQALDTSVILDQNEQLPEFEVSSGLDAEKGTLILVANAPETRAVLNALRLRRWQNWNIVGYWAWELEQIDPTWLPISHHLNEIWTPSQFVTSAFSSHVDIPVRTVPIPVFPPANLDTNPSDPSTLSVLVMADGRSSFHRKNVLAAAKMFVEAFKPNDPVRLTLKLKNLDEYSTLLGDLNEIVKDRTKISIFKDSISDHQRWQLIADHDVILATHRAEGFGLHLAEAMSLGKCAIATGWSGNLQFMNNQNSILLPFSLERAKDPFGIYSHIQNARWAAIDIPAGAQLLRSVWSDRSASKRLGQKALADMNSLRSRSTFLDSIDHHKP